MNSNVGYSGHIVPLETGVIGRPNSHINKFIYINLFQKSTLICQDNPVMANLPFLSNLRWFFSLGAMFWNF